MKRRIRLQPLTNKNALSSVRVYRAALILAILVSIVSALRLTFDLGYNLGTFEHSQLNHRTCCVNFEESFLIPITLGLALISLSLLMRRVLSLIVSTLGLLWVGLIYILWYRGTLSIIEAAEVQSFYGLPNQTQYFLPLNGATWWDVAVLAIVIMLLIWHIKTLGPMVRQIAQNRRLRFALIKNKDSDKRSDDQLDQGIDASGLPTI